MVRQGESVAKHAFIGINQIERVMVLHVFRKLRKRPNRREKGAFASYKRQTDGRSKDVRFRVVVINGNGLVLLEPRLQVLTNLLDTPGKPKTGRYGAELVADWESRFTQGENPGQVKNEEHSDGYSARKPPTLRHKVR